MAHIKVTKDGESNTIIADMDWVQSIYPTSDGYAHEVVTNTPSESELLALKKREEREWRDYELQRTDALILLPDHPDKDNFTTYRQALRDWPSAGNFPDTRPTLGD